MIYNEKPENFTPRLETVGCFLENNGEFLILHRHDHKPQGNTWGLPGGKIEPNENPREAVIRETEEETGCKIDFTRLSYFKGLYVRYNDYDFVYHIFHLPIKQKIDIKLEENSHKDFKWIKPEEALEMNNLIQDFDECIKQFYGIK
jgi:8-oxo-dGTP pyrophosphatase MutT (NUDIX family)